MAGTPTTTTVGNIHNLALKATTSPHHAVLCDAADQPNVRNSDTDTVRVQGPRKNGLHAQRSTTGDDPCRNGLVMTGLPGARGDPIRD
jgi:CTP:molybdopterin cytidylyltransferase MocA